MSSAPALRSRPDLCPGVRRPWPADDGALVRLRLAGGQISAASLVAIGEVAARFGDGEVHLTGRANVQLRALPYADAETRTELAPEVVAAIAATGLLPSRSHELARNLMASPQSGLAGGRADLRPLVRDLDRQLCADPALADLPGRFLVVLDDGRGDLVERPCDLGLVALDPASCQLRVGGHYGEVLATADAPARLVQLARAFVSARGDRPGAAWHVAELGIPLAEAHPPDPRVPSPTPPLPSGRVPGGAHVVVPDGVLDRTAIAGLAAAAPHLVVTPWRGVLVPATEAVA